MKTLIIGGGGFVGHHLTAHLAKQNRQVYATHLPGETVNGQATTYELDILNPTACKQALENLQPREIYHLAAQSSAAVSWKMPLQTMDVNVKGTINILESMRGLSHSPRILLVGSGEEYGAVRPEELPISEDLAPNPANVYAITKATQTMLGKLYASAYGLDIVMTRSFNHIGPGQSDTFAVPSFCKQIAEIESGRAAPTIKVGNLSAKRDFTDVRDVVRAYSLLLEKGKSGEVYNVGSGTATSLQDILDNLLSLTPVHIDVKQDPDRMRPVDVPIIVADISKLKHATGWAPKYTITATLKDIIEYWRGTISKG